MSTTTDTERAAPRAGLGLVKATGWILVIVGIVMAIAGGTTWFLVQSQLANEKISVADDARWFAGDAVDGPLTAFAQADIINHHALDISGGKTYAELDRQDPKRATVMDASFLRASLFTSVLAFGVAFMAGALGVFFILIGLSLARLARARY